MKDLDLVDLHPHLINKVAHHPHQVNEVGLHHLHQQINVLVGLHHPLQPSVLMGHLHPLQISEMDPHHRHQINEVAPHLLLQILEVDHLLPLTHVVLRLSEVTLHPHLLQLTTGVDPLLHHHLTEVPHLPHHLGVEACPLLHRLLIESRYLYLLLNKNHSLPFSKTHSTNQIVKIQHNLTIIRQQMFHQHQPLPLCKHYVLSLPQIKLPHPPLVEVEMLY